MFIDFLAAELSLLAYAEPEEAQAGACELFASLGLALSRDDVAWLDIDDTQVLLAGPFVAFRGTESLADVRDDLGCVARPLQSLALPLASTLGIPLWHAGFTRAFARVREALESRFWRLGSFALPSDLQSVRCYTGHSLGGALAALAVAEAISGEPAACITFGAPRPGNGAAARLVRQRAAFARRWVHGSDVVPRLPPALLGFRHAGDLRYLRQDGTLDERSNAVSRAVERLRGRLASGPLDGVRDHGMAHYVQALRRLRPDRAA
jgi:hypothetical protein